MKGILALFGSGEFTPAMEPVDKFLLGKTPNPRIAILPTAAGQEMDFHKWIDMGVAHYKKLGFAAQGFSIKDRGGMDSKSNAQELSTFNFFVFSGGDPGYLLDTLQGSLVWKSILKKYNEGTTLVASSAGAMVLGAKTWTRIHQFEKTATPLPWEKGLGLVGFGIIPHFDYIVSESSPEKLSLMAKSLPSDIPVIGIEEDTAYIQEDGKWTVMGSGKVHNPAILIK